MKKSKEDLVLTVDIGTGSVRAMTFNISGDIAAKDSRKSLIYQEHFNWATQKPEEIFQNLLEVCKNVVYKSTSKGGHIIGWTISTYYHSLVLIDNYGTPISDVITWADLRSYKQVERIKKDYDVVKIYSKTGCPVHPMYPFSKLFWFKENTDILEDKRVHICSLKDYLIYKLFRELLIDEAVASTLGLLNINSLSWDKDILEMVGIPIERLSTVVSSNTIIDGHRLKKEYREFMGLKEETPFIIGAGDGVLSNLGMGMIETQDLGIMIGTSGAIRTFSQNPILDEKQRVWCYYFTNGLWVIGGAINNGGIVLRWLRDNLFQDLKEKADRLGLDSYEIILNEISKVPPGAYGIIVLPFLTGERSPFWNDKAQGTVLGLGLIHSRTSLARAMIEGVCYRMYSVYNALKDATRIENFREVRAGGGFSRSRIWVQMMADIFNETLRVPNLEENTSLGAMILACWSLGIVHSLRDAKKIVKVKETIYPNHKNHSLYKKLYEIYMKAYNSLGEIFLDIARFKEDL
ncbi:MAG: gluconokinase [bacterium]